MLFFNSELVSRNNNAVEVLNPGDDVLMFYAAAARNISTNVSGYLNKKVVSTAMIRDFLKNVVYGDLDAVKRQLNCCPDLVRAIGHVIDLSGRKFTNVTGFQYATWAMDQEMIDLIGGYLSPIEQKEQLLSFCTDHGRYFDLTLLSNTLYWYAEKYDDLTLLECRRHICVDLAQAQKMLPAWIIHAWMEQGQDVAWTKKDFTQPIGRMRENVDNWFRKYYVRRLAAPDPDESFAWRRGACFSPFQIVQPGGFSHDRDCIQSLLKKAVDDLFALEYRVNNIKDNGDNLENNSTNISNADINDFLKFVMRGDLCTVESLIINTPILARLSGSIEDLAGWRLEDITAFQYAVLALDRDMWELLLKYLPGSVAKKQYQSLATKMNLFYYHDDIKNLLDKLNSYIENYEKWSVVKCKDFIRGEFANAQRYLPSWLIYAYMEEGLDTAWVRADFSKPIKRSVDLLPIWFNNHHSRSLGNPDLERSYAWRRGKCKTPFHFVQPGLADHGHDKQCINLLLDKSLKTRVAIDALYDQPIVISVRENAEVDNMAPIKCDFQPDTINQFLRAVVMGDIATVADQLAKYPALVHAMGSIRDLSGREFIDITGFQYAVWALDEEMWSLMLNHGELSGRLTKEHAKAQLSQYAHRCQGSSAVGHFGLHYDFNSILNPLSYYINQREKMTTQERQVRWRVDVGNGQRQLPAWVVYCWGQSGVDTAWAKNNFSGSIGIPRNPGLLQTWWGTDALPLGHFHRHSWGRGVNNELIALDGSTGHYTNPYRCHDLACLQQLAAKSALSKARLNVLLNSPSQEKSSNTVRQPDRDDERHFSI